MKLTSEQEAILEAARSGRNITVQAGAGCGKSSTLREIAQALPHKRILFVAYNASVRAEMAGKMPPNVSCHTGHSYARRVVANKWHGYLERLTTPRQPAGVQAAILGLTSPQRLAKDVVFTPTQLARLAMGAITNWCRSDALEPQPEHVPVPKGLDPKHAPALREMVMPIVNRARADIRSRDGQLRWEHDYYLKMAQLTVARGGISLPFDLIMVDECQDTNLVTASLYLDTQPQAQRIIVGDSCQPAGTMVTVVTAPAKKGRNGSGIPAQTAQVPIEQIKPGDVVVSMNLEKSFIHRSGSPVSGVSARYYEGDLIKVETAEGLTSRYTPDHHCIVRFGEELVNKHVVYLMKRGDDYRIGITSGRVQSQNKRIGVSFRASQEKADAAWILSVHDSRREAALAEMMIAWTYGFWAKCGGNRDAAERVLKAHGRMIEFPLWGNGERYLQTRRPTVVRACNLIDGMEVLPLDKALLSGRHPATYRQWSRITVTREPYKGLVYSMTVERDHTYVGDGIFTHNCQAINGWNGAVDILSTFPADVVLTLSQSFRFGPAIAEEANKWLDLLGAKLRLKGFEKVPSEIGPVDKPDAILCRTNATAMAEVFAVLKQGGTPALVGGGNDIASLAKAALILKQGGRPEHPDLMAFTTWAEVQDYVSQDPRGSDLRTFVDLVDTYGAEAVLDVATKVKNAEHAAPGDTVVSTAHKAKGLEWPTVRVSGDFHQPIPGENPPLPREEMMLNYVTVTRARERISLGPLDLTQYFANTKRPASRAEIRARLLSVA
ncbi:AAA family ATPase [Thermobispora bispora]|uniref:AAA family ATPase n=1 Tax=Thermobispora bispora TaxID=2006 RepID=UPI0019809B87|nr:AAA family ATPase [Thermobispora bispora]QSI49950.1 hypothetical protein CYL17_18395 [Thermobispora bispora]